MNEKHQQYFNVKNDKTLIEQRTPTENDLEKFEEWKKIKRKQFSRECIAMSVVLLFFIIYGVSSKSILGIILIILFSLIEIYIIKNYFTSKSWKPEYCDYGIIIDKYIKYEKKGNDKDYYAIVEANQNQLKFRLKLNEYQSLEVSDEVIIFAVKGKQEVYMKVK